MDEEIRQLEHLAATGDRDAQLQLGAAYLRSGHITIPKTVEEVDALEKLGLVAVPALLARVDAGIHLDLPPFFTIQESLYSERVFNHARSLAGQLQTTGSLWEQAAMFIETDIQPFMTKPTDDPAWWVQDAEEHHRITPHLISILLRAFEEYQKDYGPSSTVDSRTNRRVPDGIKTAEKAKQMLRGSKGSIVAWCDACDDAIYETEADGVGMNSALCNRCGGGRVFGAGF